MTKKRKVRYDRVLILILIVVLLAVCAGYLGFGLIKLFSGKKDTNKPVVPENGIKETVQLSLNSYEVYLNDVDDLDFGFVVAEFQIKCDGKVEADLSDFETEEKIRLNEVSSYTKKLLEKGYDLSRFNVVNKIETEQSEYTFKTLIPYKTDKNELKLYFNGSPVKFDLSVNTINISSLKESVPGIDIVGTEYDIHVYDSFISTEMKYDGQEFNVPETIKYYTFKLKVNKTSGNVKIAEAKYIIEGDDVEHYALESNYSSMKAENIIDRYLNAGDEGALFFDIYNPDRVTNFKGTLKIRFSDSDQWIDISSDLR